MQTIHDIRLANLAMLLERFPSKAEFARRIGTSPAYITHLMSKTTDANIGTRFARNCELALGLDVGWMDQRNTNFQPNETSRVKDLLGKRLTPPISGSAAGTVRRIHRRRAATENNPLGRPEQMTLASAPQSSVSLLRHSFPIRKDVLAEIVVPIGMTTDEAKRLCAFLMTLATDFTPD